MGSSKKDYFLLVLRKNVKLKIKVLTNIIVLISNLKIHKNLKYEIW